MLPLTPAVPASHSLTPKGNPELLELKLQMDKEGANSFSIQPANYSPVHNPQSSHLSLFPSHTYTHSIKEQSKTTFPKSVSPFTAFTFPTCPLLPTQVRVMLKKLLIY